MGFAKYEELEIELEKNKQMLIELRDNHLHGAATVVRALIQKRIEAADKILYQTK